MSLVYILVAVYFLCLLSLAALFLYGMGRFFAAVHRELIGPTWPAQYGRLRMSFVPGRFLEWSYQDCKEKIDMASWDHSCG